MGDDVSVCVERGLVPFLAGGGGHCWQCECFQGAGTQVRISSAAEGHCLSPVPQKGATTTTTTMQPSLSKVGGDRERGGLV